MESILDSIKKLLGIAEDDTDFDPDIIMHINSVFMILHQMGVGPSEIFQIEDDTSTWYDFTPDIPRIAAVKSYIHLKVKLIFDPPDRSAVLEAYKETIRELESRLNMTEVITSEESENDDPYDEDDYY